MRNKADIYKTVCEPKENRYIHIQVYFSLLPNKKKDHLLKHRRVFAGSHPRLSDLAWSSENFETARTRRQLENTTSAVQDMWIADEKSLQQLHRKKLPNIFVNVSTHWNTNRHALAQRQSFVIEYLQ
ncbi:hypothetical protein PanWU01x14_136430 [Parasponia andersonii]|uniref:Uncharacterized protein n=1 Tax=Parasponia andersonii TaxID=3476 RepID=A0A2P5CNX2_PARAD|nr:hypothetical protein PanWU01x14_136430 [Parasponia andersonii]